MKEILTEIEDLKSRDMVQCQTIIKLHQANTKLKDRLKYKHQRISSQSVSTQVNLPIIPNDPEEPEKDEKLSDLRSENHSLKIENENLKSELEIYKISSESFEKTIQGCYNYKLWNQKGIQHYQLLKESYVTLAKLYEKTVEQNNSLIECAKKIDDIKK